MTSFSQGDTHDRSPLEDQAKPAKENYEHSMEDIKNHVIGMIRLYKNYFIDRVEWNNSKQITRYYFYFLIQNSFSQIAHSFFSLMRRDSILSRLSSLIIVSAKGNSTLSSNRI